MKKPCWPWPLQPRHGQLGRDPPRAFLRNGTKRHLGAAFCKTILCSGNEPQPQCSLAKDRSACLVLPWPYAPHRTKEALGCLWLRGDCCLAGGLRSLRPTPHVFSFGEKADLA